MNTKIIVIILTAFIVLTACSNDPVIDNKTVYDLPIIDNPDSGKMIYKINNDGMLIPSITPPI